MWTCDGPGCIPPKQWPWKVAAGKKMDGLFFSWFCFCMFVNAQNRTEAREVMQGRNPPANCIQAFSKDGDQIYTNRNYTAEQTRANFLSGDVEEEIRWAYKNWSHSGGFILLCMLKKTNKTFWLSLIFLAPIFYLFIFIFSRHLQRELENQNALHARFQQHMRKLDEDIKQNQTLLRRTHTEQRNIKVTFCSHALTDVWCNKDFCPPWEMWIFLLIILFWTTSNVFLSDIKFICLY